MSRCIVCMANPAETRATAKRYVWKPIPKGLPWRAPQLWLIARVIIGFDGAIFLSLNRIVYKDRSQQWISSLRGRCDVCGWRKVHVWSSGIYINGVIPVQSNFLFPLSVTGFCGWIMIDFMGFSGRWYSCDKGKKQTCYCDIDIRFKYLHDATAAVKVSGNDYPNRWLSPRWWQKSGVSMSLPISSSFSSFIIHSIKISGLDKYGFSDDSHRSPFDSTHKRLSNLLKTNVSSLQTPASHSSLIHALYITTFHIRKQGVTMFFFQ